jgi:formylglycine-generating enzyme required for sulfatase activity
MNGDLAANGCPITGNGCLDVYAVSIPGVTPSRWVSWFQAVAIARNSLKRLPTNQEWQAAALGTPDGAPCKLFGILGTTGSEPGCVSDVGAFDMVGNVSERVAEWADQGDFGNNCTNWPADFGNDVYCIGGKGSSDENRLPGVPVRSGYFGSGESGGVFSAIAFPADLAANTIGFRCAR